MDFIFVQYGRNKYPEEITPGLIEVAGHLDKEKIKDCPNYSLHTEYSYGKRNYTSEMLKKYSTLCNANKEKVPQLWKSEEWAEEFAEFVIELTKEHAAPAVVEIHPPFNDYCDINQFLERYSVFEKIIHEKYPDTEIVVENRAGTEYKGGRFIIGKAQEIAKLCDQINETGTKLGVVLDFPQLITAEHLDTEKFDVEKYFVAVEIIKPYQATIKGIHIWGKKKNESGRWVPHRGDLDTYFPNPDDKEAFIEGIKRICSDGLKRFLVPEVNSGEEDFKSVVKDILK